MRTDKPRHASARRTAVRVIGVGAFALVCLDATVARSDLRLCNRTSYVLDVALGLESHGAAATRGWFRVNPGECRGVMQGTIEAEAILVYSRGIDVYGASPVAQSGDTDLCVAMGNFVLAGAKSCSARGGQELVRFTAVKPSESDQGLTATLAEEADYSDDQARLAGIQRLLGIAGYDVSPIDGIAGRKTDTAIIQFLKDHQLGNDAVIAPTFFDALSDAARKSGTGFAWCNDTSSTVMAALGIETNGAIVTRGWYRIEPGKCLKPEIDAKPRRLYSFAEAVDRDGQTLKTADRPVAWGGAAMLCTRPVRFEIEDQSDCAGNGLTLSGFAPVELRGNGAPTLRFREKGQ